MKNTVEDESHNDDENDRPYNEKSHIPPIQVVVDHGVLVVPTSDEINQQGCEDI